MTNNLRGDLRGGLLNGSIVRKLGILQLKLILCNKGDMGRAGGGVESLDLNGKMLEMKISTDMEMGTCLIRIEENWSAALRARLLLSISLLVS